MENIKSGKIQTEGLIFFVLLSGSRHTDEIKEIIDEKFTPVKLGTLYASISKMLASKTIQEFRASSVNGSRRKYYKITPFGLKTYNTKYASLFEGVDALPPVKNNFENAFDKIVSKRQSKPKTAVKDEETTANDNIVVETENPVDYSEYFNAINDTQNNEIDFSILDNSTSETTDNNKIQDSTTDFSSLDGEDTTFDDSVNFNDSETNNETYNKPLFDRDEIEKSTQFGNKLDKGVDYDSFISSNYEYSSVLSKIFPKQTNYLHNEPVKTDETISLTQETITEKQVNGDWSDIYELSEKDGIKMHTSSDTNRYRGSKILVNKLLLFTSIALLCAGILEFLLLNLFFINKIEFSSTTFIKIIVIFASLTLVTTILFIINPSYSKKDLPRFINAIEIALILAISAIIITFAVTAIKNVDFYNVNEMFYNLILPSITLLNVPLFVVIEYALAKLEFFQSI